MNNLQSYYDLFNEKINISKTLSRAKYRYDNGENPIKRDKTPKWETKKDGNKYYVMDPRGGEWVEISKNQFDDYNKDRQKRFESRRYIKENIQSEQETLRQNYNDKTLFFQWLDNTNNRDLWEALIDQENFPSEQERTIMIGRAKERLMKKYEQTMNIDSSWRKRVFGRN